MFKKLFKKAKSAVSKVAKGALKVAGGLVSKAMPLLQSIPGVGTAISIAKFAGGLFGGGGSSPAAQAVPEAPEKQYQADPGQIPGGSSRGAAYSGGGGVPWYQNKIIWIVGGVLTLGAGFFLMKRKR
jgi:uncharacterized membrane protein